MLVKVKILNNIITIQSKFICHKFSRGSLSSSYSLCVNGSAMAPAHLIVVYRNFTIRQQTKGDFLHKVGTSLWCFRNGIGKSNWRVVRAPCCTLWLNLVLIIGVLFISSCGISYFASPCHFHGILWSSFLLFVYEII